MIFVQNELVIQSYDETVPCLKSELLATPLSSEFREICETQIEIASRHKRDNPDVDYKNQLIITNKIGAMSPEDVEYVNTVQDKKLAALGVKRAAIIIPEDIFHMLNLQEYMDSENFGIKKRMFDNEKDAVDWLQS